MSTRPGQGLGEASVWGLSRQKHRNPPLRVLTGLSWQDRPSPGTPASNLSRPVLQLLLLTPFLSAPAHLVDTQSLYIAVDDEFDRRFEAAGDDAAKLWDLVEWCERTKLDKEANTALRKLIKVEPDHARARKKLGHVRFDGQWFTSEKKLEAYQEKEAARLAKEQGLIKWKKQWVREQDIPFLERGLVRGPDGDWWTEDDLEKHEEGWVRQDLVWVSPQEAEKIGEGLWKCGEEWLDLEGANRYHARPNQPWRIPSDRLILRTTCTREVAAGAILEMERAVPDLVKIFGRMPDQKVEVFLSGNGAILGTLCSEGFGGMPAIEGRGLIESVEIVFAESWFHVEERTWHGVASTWWDPSEENGARFGPHRARAAMGLGFADAIDPSPKAVEKLIQKKGPFDGFAESYYAEKQLPEWFRWGASCYVGRYYAAQVERGGDPFWTRKWSVDNLKRKGGLPSFLRGVFEMEMTGREEDSRNVLSAGLLMAFILDGQCGPVRAAHAELKVALKEGKDPGKILDKLRKEIEKHEDELRAFAGL